MLVAHLVVDDRVSALVVGPATSDLVDVGPLQPLRDRLDALTADLTMAAAHRDDPLAVPLRAALRARLGDRRRAAGRTPGRPARRQPGRAHALGVAGRDAVEPAARADRTAADHPPVGDPLAGDAWCTGAARGRAGRRAGGLPRRGGGDPRGRGLVGGRPPGRRRRHDEPGGRDGLAGRRAAPGRARPAHAGEPALLRRRAARRAVVRLRHRPARPRARDRRALGVRAGPGLGARRRGGDRHERRLAARRRTDGAVLAGPDRRRRGLRGDGPLARAGRPRGGAGRRPGRGRPQSADDVVPMLSFGGGW